MVDSLEENGTLSQEWTPSGSSDGRHCQLHVRLASRLSGFAQPGEPYFFGTTCGGPLQPQLTRKVCVPTTKEETRLS